MPERKKSHIIIHKSSLTGIVVHMRSCIFFLNGIHRKKTIQTKYAIYSERNDDLCVIDEDGRRTGRK